jgi:hypothetical protein
LLPANVADILATDGQARSALLTSIDQGRFADEVAVVTRLTEPIAIPSRTMPMEHSRTLQMRRSELDRYLIELIRHETWIEGITSLLASPRAYGRPWPYYRDEYQVWE